ncbi:hypothetical protein K435DRAFT_17260 [Dendrothele bispora CBS 962.96]|uniref:RING-type domain-containing protein n=1 Tax=Dendrothele bispora (strain CBS 962.96) TaxID=1314807 RepID=A0A4S8MZL0_DENBC|nr:hypothetical protein K435DRAFT_17260 [Dendrothele bispora CBS 962.96]
MTSFILPFDLVEDDAGDSPELRNRIREMVLARLESLDLGQTSRQLSPQEMQKIISELPRIGESQLKALGHEDSVCPICFTSLLALLVEEETAQAMDSPAHPIEELGVTRLSQPWQCGHIFCRRDISRWIHEGHDSCPTCRRRLIKQEDESPESSTAEPEHGDAYDQDIFRILQTIPGGIGSLGDPDSFIGDPLSFFQGPPLYNPPRSEQDEDRSEFLGMYS